MDFNQFSTICWYMCYAWMVTLWWAVWDAIVAFRFQLGYKYAPLLSRITYTPPMHIVTAVISDCWFFFLFFWFFFFFCIWERTFSPAAHKRVNNFCSVNTEHTHYSLLFFPPGFCCMHTYCFSFYYYYSFFFSFFAREMCALAIFSCINCGWPNLLFLHRRRLV